MYKHIDLIKTISEISKCERIIFEKSYGNNLDNISKEDFKSNSELYDLLSSLSLEELSYINQLAFPHLKSNDRSTCINNLFNCFELDKLLPIF